MTCLQSFSAIHGMVSSTKTILELGKNALLLLTRIFFICLQPPPPRPLGDRKNSPIKIRYLAYQVWALSHLSMYCGTKSVSALLSQQTKKQNHCLASDYTLLAFGVYVRFWRVNHHPSTVCLQSHPASQPACSTQWQWWMCNIFVALLFCIPLHALTLLFSMEIVRTQQKRLPSKCLKTGVVFWKQQKKREKMLLIATCLWSSLSSSSSSSVAAT